MQDTQLESARNYEKAGDFKAAAQIYQQLLDKKHDDKELLLGMAEAQRRLGENDKAIAYYDAALAKDPALIGAKEGKALALLSKGDFETPVPLFEDVLQADPRRWKTLNGLGILFTTRNMQPEAQQYFREALKQSPNNLSVMNNLGLSQALERHYDSAADTLTQASELAQQGTSERKRIDLNLALVNAVAGRLDNAKAIASQYFSGATLNNNLGLYAHLAKDDQLSKAYLNMALSQSKTFYDKAWENLQAISGGSNNAPAAAKPAPAKQEEKTTAAPEQGLKLPEPKKSLPAKPAEETAKPAEASRKKGAADEQIINIVNSSSEEAAGDIVKPSPIP